MRTIQFGDSITMYISEKGKLILKILLDSTESISVDKIGDKLCMSPRSVRTYMKEVGITLKDLTGIFGCCESVY